jgi:hypothetical protein
VQMFHLFHGFRRKVSAGKFQNEQMCSGLGFLPPS